MKKLFTVAVMALSVIAFTVALALCQDAKLSKDQVDEIAKKAASEKGMVLDVIDTVYDEGNQKWIQYEMVVQENPGDPNHGNLPKGTLENKKYQVVFLDVRDSEMDAWAFIDPDTGDVLAFYMEK